MVGCWLAAAWGAAAVRKGAINLQSRVTASPGRIARTLLHCHVQERVAKLVVQLRERLAAYSTLGKEGFEQVRLWRAVSWVLSELLCGWRAAHVVHHSAGWGRSVGVWGCLPAPGSPAPAHPAASASSHLRNQQCVRRPCGRRPTGSRKSTLGRRCCRPAATSTRERAPRWGTVPTALAENSIGGACSASPCSRRHPAMSALPATCECSMGRSSARYNTLLTLPRLWKLALHDLCSIHRHAS